MTRHDPYIAVEHMREHAAETIHLAAGSKRGDLDSNRLLVLALTRLVEIIGEAATRVPQDVRVKYPEVMWSEIVGTRNRLIHGYDKVDLDILWQIVSVDLHKLLLALSTDE